jgi:hypothetical protein
MRHLRHSSYRRSRSSDSSTMGVRILDSGRQGACLVQSTRGSLPLQEIVLPIINPQLDEGRLIPAVDI